MTPLKKRIIYQTSFTLAFLMVYFLFVVCLFDFKPIPVAARPTLITIAAVSLIIYNGICAFDHRL
jgi:uncharacterized membrane protein (DUF485 family)